MRFSVDAFCLSIFKERSGMFCKKAMPSFFVLLAGLSTFAFSTAVDTINGSLKDSANGLAVSGVTVKSEGDSTLSKADGSFQLLIKVTTHTILRDQARQERSIAWNPRSGAFTMTGHLGDVSIRVHTIQGSIVAQYSSSKFSKGPSFSLADLPQGAYMVTLRAHEYQEIYKIFKINTGKRAAYSMLSPNSSALSNGNSSIIATLKSHVITFAKDGYLLKTESVPAGLQLRITVILTRTKPKAETIFDGATLAGWIPVPNNGWNVNAADSAIQCTGAGRGFIYTEKKYLHYRLIYWVKQPKPDHMPCVLFFGQNVNADAMGAFQFSLPSLWTWDYRPGANNGGGAFVKSYTDPKVDVSKWTKCELVVNTQAGTAVAALAQPPEAKAVKVLSFYDEKVKTYNPAQVAFQSHNANIRDEYKNIMLEENPATDSLITTQ